jgi:hypothetical protein
MCSALAPPEVARLVSPWALLAGLHWASREAQLAVRRQAPFHFDVVARHPRAARGAALSSGTFLQTGQLAAVGLSKAAALRSASPQSAPLPVDFLASLPLASRLEDQ